MPLSSDEVKTLLGKLAKRIKDYSSDYKLVHKKIDTEVNNFLEQMTVIGASIETELLMSDLSFVITEYERHVGRVKEIAEEAIKNGTKFFFSNDELIRLGNEVKSMTLKDGQLLQLRDDFEKQLVSKKESETFKQLVKIIPLVTIQANNETYNALTAVFKNLQLQGNVIKTIESAPTNESQEITQLKYIPFPQFKEPEFTIEGFDINLFNTPEKISDWGKNNPNNRIPYEMVKLSECTSDNVFAALILIGEILKRANAQSPSAYHKLDEQLINATKAVYTKLIENWNKSWNLIKSTIIQPANESAPTILKNCLEKILRFEESSIRHNHMYRSDEKKIQALCSLLFYSDPNEESHLLPKNKEAVTKLSEQLQDLSQSNTNSSTYSI